MNINDVRCVLIVGAGTMGQQIGVQCAMHGYDVTLYDVSSDALETAVARTRAFASQFVAKGRLTEEAADAMLARISTTVNPQEAASEADLLSESVPEDPELKAKVFFQFNEHCPPHAIFTTNTSTLVPSMFAEATGRPSKFAALHFHQYVWQSNVVDIMPHPGTSEDTVQLLHAFAKRIGQIPIFLKKESPSYVFNAMFEGLISAALTLKRNGVAAVEDVDRAWMGVMKTRTGPFGTLDRIGLETMWYVFDHRAKATNNSEARAVADLFKEYVDKGWLGVKSGRGFYIYPEPAYQQPGFLTGE